MQVVVCRKAQYWTATIFYYFIFRNYSRIIVAVVHASDECITMIFSSTKVTFEKSNVAKVCIDTYRQSSTYQKWATRLSFICKTRCSNLQHFEWLSKGSWDIYIGDLDKFGDFLNEVIDEEDYRWTTTAVSVSWQCLSLPTHVEELQLVNGGMEGLFWQGITD